MILDTRNDTTLQEAERVSLVIRPMTDKGYRGYFFSPVCLLRDQSHAAV
jgi:hypothetical protein